MDATSFSARAGESRRRRDLNPRRTQEAETVLEAHQNGLLPVLDGGRVCAIVNGVQPETSRAGPIGREQELAQLSTFLEQERLGAEALLLEGEPGIGKSTLWRAAVDSARSGGYRVLEARPAEPERGLSFSALADLLEGVPFQDLPPPLEEALRASLLTGPASGGDAHAVARGVPRLRRRRGSRPAPWTRARRSRRRSVAAPFRGTDEPRGGAAAAAAASRGGDPAAGPPAPVCSVGRQPVLRARARSCLAGRGRSRAAVAGAGEHRRAAAPEDRPPPAKDAQRAPCGGGTVLSDRCRATHGRPGRLTVGARGGGAARDCRDQGRACPLQPPAVCKRAVRRFAAGRAQTAAPSARRRGRGWRGASAPSRPRL